MGNLVAISCQFERGPFWAIILKINLAKTCYDNKMNAGKTKKALLDFCRTIKQMMSNKTVSECTKEQFGFDVSNGPARFRKAGWFSVGRSVSNCPSCSESMWAYRKPYKTKTGATYHYWALVCSICKSAFEPAELNDNKRSLLYESSELKPSKKITEIQDVRKVLLDIRQDTNQELEKNEIIELEQSLRPCVICGERIPRERTLKNPDARHCVTCLSSLEGDFRHYIDEGIAGTREEHKSIRGKIWSDLRNRDN